MNLSLLQGDKSKSIADFEGLNDGFKVLVEVKSNKPLLVDPTSARTAKPAIGSV